MHGDTAKVLCPYPGAMLRKGASDCVRVANGPGDLCSASRRYLEG
jgi:hypothetical protein